MYKVIIVEDERAIRRGLCILIDWESIGFTVEATAEDGLEALNMLEKKNFDVVLTDIRMPKLDGLGLAREIRERNINADMIILSGYKNFEYARTALEYGVKNYILKPVDADILTKTLKSIKKVRDAAANEYPVPSGSENDIVAKIKRYIYENYKEDLSLKLFADEFHYNPAYLGRIFAGSTGMTFRNYLNLCRAYKAAKLLERGRYKVAEVSELVGYKDINYFCRVFKSVHNVPPSEYRTGK